MLSMGFANEMDRHSTEGLGRDLWHLRQDIDLVEIYHRESFEKTILKFAALALFF